MCGFVGFYSKDVRDENVIKEMNNQIIHRGPDSDGYYFDNGINFGFRRLSIIDLHEGSQPILNEGVNRAQPTDRPDVNIGLRKVAKDLLLKDFWVCIFPTAYAQHIPSWNH